MSRTQASSQYLKRVRTTEIRNSLISGSIEPLGGAGQCSTLPLVAVAVRSLAKGRALMTGLLAAVGLVVFVVCFAVIAIVAGA